MKKLFRRIIYAVLYIYISIRKQLRLSRSAIVVLIYHNVEQFEFDAFRKQIEFMKKNYALISYDEFKDMMRSQNRIKGLHILITFDDGFRSNKLVADEILTPNGIKSILFIPAYLVSRNLSPAETQRFITENLKEPPMNETFVSVDDLKSLIESGHTIGSHGYNHYRFSTLASQHERETEIVSSASELQEKLDYNISALAYPFGGIQYVDEASLLIAAKTYTHVFSGVRGSNTNKTHPAAIRRDTVTPSLKLRELRLIIEGGLSVLYFFKRRKLDRMAKNVSPGT